MEQYNLAELEDKILISNLIIGTHRHVRKIQATYSVIYEYMVRRILPPQLTRSTYVYNQKCFVQIYSNFIRN